MIEWLKSIIAGKELSALQRYRVASTLARQWNGKIPASSETAEWIQSVGEGERGYDIEQFRESLSNGSNGR